MSSFSNIFVPLRCKILNQAYFKRKKSDASFSYFASFGINFPTIFHIPTNLCKKHTYNTPQKFLLSFFHISTRKKV